MKSLVEAEFRRAFAQDHRSALDRSELEAEALSERQLEVLARLSEEELEIVAGVVAQLREAAPGGVVSL